ncbi:hypothetical protein BD414DRAFT_471602 [Trametes punicea]|nr:hypothetical protein BD414DRAFT_471602 [Trametes punicea]
MAGDTLTPEMRRVVTNLDRRERCAGGVACRMDGARWPRPSQTSWWWSKRQGRRCAKHRAETGGRPLLIVLGGHEGR